MHTCLMGFADPMRLPSIFGAIEYTADEQMYIESSRSHMAWLFKQYLENAQNRHNIKFGLQNCDGSGIEVTIQQIKVNLLRHQILPVLVSLLVSEMQIYFQKLKEATSYS